MEVGFRDFEDSSSSKTNEKLAHEKKSLRLSLIFLSKTDSGKIIFQATWLWIITRCTDKLN